MMECLPADGQRQDHSMAAVVAAAVVTTTEGAAGLLIVKQLMKTAALASVMLDRAAGAPVAVGPQAAAAV